MKLTAEVKKSIIKKLAGAFKNTDLNNDNLWREVLKRRSRKRLIKTWGTKNIFH